MATRDTKTATNESARTTDATKAAEAARTLEGTDAAVVGNIGQNTAPLGGYTYAAEDGKVQRSPDSPVHIQAVAPIFPEGADGNQMAIAEHSTELADEQTPAPTGDSSAPEGTKKPEPPKSSSV
jgi:hypothetical protein